MLVIIVSFSYYFKHPSYSQEGCKCRESHVEVSKIGTWCIYHFIKSIITVQRTPLCTVLYHINVYAIEVYYSSHCAV